MPCLHQWKQNIVEKQNHASPKCFDDDDDDGALGKVW
jgi:hypothetical protein